MKQAIAVLFGLGLLVNSLLFVPQLIQVWRKRSGENVSLLTFGGFNVLQAIAIVHGYLEHDTSLMLGTVASLITSGGVTVLCSYYRLRDRKIVPAASAAKID